jgi:hypothetical protein
MAGVERGVVSGRTWDIGLPASTHWSGLVRMISRQLAEREQASIQQHQHHWANARVFAPGHPAGLTGEEDVYREPPLPSMTDAWRRTLLELDGVVETCKSLNAELIIVHATDTLELSKQPDHRLPSRAIRQWAQSRGLPFVNLADDYLAATGGDAERIEKMFLDGTHPSPEGARVMAKRLTDAVFEHALDGLE